MSARADSGDLVVQICTCEKRDLTEHSRWMDISTAGLPHVTDLLLAWSNGDRGALDALIPLVHEQLLILARRYMAHENAGHTLQATALVNEAYLRMVDMRRVDWRDRAHFFAIGARVMRHILVDLARSKRFQKRGGDISFVSLDEVEPPGSSAPYDVLGLNDALTALARKDSRRGKIVELRVFGGLTIEETAAALEISTDTVTRDWKLAKAWLARELTRSRSTNEKA
jgi:RNA polymerase sigma factor (TIGR02999 family)